MTHKKTIIILLSVLAVILLAIATLGLILATQPEPQAKAPQATEYSFTKAVCTEGNFCQDVVVACKNKQTVSITPIQGAFAQFSPNWQDPRSQEQIEKECD
ncbi:MAG: hypothetical protein AABW51_04520 [Nanoarchaeota archaeon]